MDHVIGPLVTSLVVILFICLFTFLRYVGGSVSEIKRQDEILLKRGLKQYNQQTGQLEWTQKGGGND